MKLFLSLLIFFIISFPVSAKDIAIIDGTIFTSPTSEPIKDGIIVVTDGKITSVGNKQQISIPENAEVIDASGKFIAAGFWNSHVHYTGALGLAAEKPSDDLQTLLNDFFLQWGFVNTVDTGSFLKITKIIKKRIHSKEVNGPKIITMSGSFVPKGGSPFYIKPIKLPEFTDENLIEAMVDEVLEEGADGIKIFSGSWSGPQSVVVMEPEHIKATTKAAHERNAMVIAHPSDSDGARIAIENGVDILAHTFPAELKGPWDKTLPAKMAERNIALIPTLKMLRLELIKMGLHSGLIDRLENNAVDQTSAAHKLGVQILFGTDVGYMSDYDTSEEFTLMERAGLDYQAVLATLTTEPAKRFGFEKTDGKIEQGFVADLVLLGSDPREKIIAFSDVHKSIRNGEVIYDRDVGK